MFSGLRSQFASGLHLRLAAACAAAKANHYILCTPASDADEFRRSCVASGLNPVWVQDFTRVGVTTVLDACSVFDGSLTKEPPCASSISALLDGARHHSAAVNADAWLTDNDPAYTVVRANLFKLARLCTDLLPAARARAAADAGLTIAPPPASASAPAPESDEAVMLRNKDESAEKMYASAKELYNRSWASDVRASNTQVIATHIGFKRGTLKMAAINSGQYGTLDAIVRSGQLALTQTEDRVSLSEADSTVDLRRLVPSLMQINRCLDSLVIAGQDEILPAQFASGNYR